MSYTAYYFFHTQIPPLRPPILYTHTQTSPQKPTLPRHCQPKKGTAAGPSVNCSVGGCYCIPCPFSLFPLPSFSSSSFFTLSLSPPTAFEQFQPATMDSTAVRALLASSLVPDADTRRRAEIQLKQVCPRLPVLFFFICFPFVCGRCRCRCRPPLQKKKMPCRVCVLLRNRRK